MPDRKNILKFLLLTLIFTIPAVVALVILSFFTFHDETQIVNLQQYFKAMDLGQFPPRWAPDMQFNAGSPFPEFNYQLPYYLGYLLHLVSINITTIFKILLGFSLVAGAAGMFLLSLEFTSPLFAFIVATVYTYTPYRAVATYVRGTLGESFALALFPFVFWALYRIRRKSNALATILASLLVASLVITHQLAAILGFPFIVLFIFGDSIFRRDFKTLLKQIGAMVLGVLISAYYTLPILAEQTLIQPSSPFNFYDHFPFIAQLLYSPFRYGASVEGPGDYLSFQLGFINIIILAVSLLGIFYFWKQTKKTNTSYLLLSLLFSTFAVLFLMNIRSSFFWRVFPYTQLVQFPWRLLMLTSFFTPILLAIISPHLPKKLFSFSAVIILAIALFPNIYYFQPGEVFNRDDNYYFHRFLPNTQLLPGETISTEYLNHAEDYVPLPVGAVRLKQLPVQKVTAIRSFEINILDSNPFAYRFNISQVQDQPFIFHTYHFPGWQAFVDQQRVNITPDDHGLITFEVPKGTHLVEVKYADSPVRHTANLITLVTLILLLEYLLFDTISHTVRIKDKISNYQPNHES